MKNNKKQEVILGFFIILFIFLIGELLILRPWDNLKNKIEINKTAEAALFNPATGEGDNVSGFAWSSNVGWISFNSTDCDADCAFGAVNCETDAAGLAKGCPAGTFSNYGVKITQIDSTTGDFSGYAWSSNVGWISFNRCGTNGICGDADGDTGDPSSDDPGGGTGAIARLNYDTGQIVGWAKILSLGDDGWIRFNSFGSIVSSEPVPFPLPLPFDEIEVGDAGASFPLPLPFDEIPVGSSGYDASIDILTGDFSGWAWNGNNNDTGIGWISFNCSNEDVCGDSDYEVTSLLNTKPTVDNLTVENANYCLPPLARTVTWNFSDTQDGNNQTGYHIQIRKSSTPDWSDPNLLINETNLSSNATQFSFTTNIEYDTNYIWRVQVIDSGGLWSDWPMHSTFDTPEHSYPNVSISPVSDPLTVYKNQEVEFIGNAVLGGGASIDKVLWVFPDADPDATSTWPNVIAKFGDGDTTRTVELGVTDTDNCTCTTTKQITVGRSLPNWIER